MKIAYLSTFYPYRGGIAQFNALLYRQLEKQHNIQAFTFKRQYPDILFPGKSQMVGPGDPADKVPSDRVLDTINPFSYLYSSVKIGKYTPDMLITKYWMPFFGPSLGRVAGSLKRRGCINISILDNVIPHEKRPGDMAFTKYFLARNNGFVVMSKSVERDLLTLKPDAEYIFHQHPLYDHFGSKIDRNAACEQLGVPPGKKVLLFFGFIRDYKGLDLLLHTLATLPEDYHVLVGGEAYGSFDSYKQIIRDRGLDSRVTLHVRYIGDEEVPLFFSAADVCVLPYKSATQSGIVGISYHFNVPVLATDVGGLKEMVTPHNTGMMVEAPTVGDLARGCTEIFRPGTLDMYSRNIDTLKQECSWETLSDAIVKFYQHLKKK